MERFEVLIVGAGPAGSTAAYRLAKAGASVLLADKARFPRDKPCGGGLTMRAVRQLPFSVEPVVEDRTTSVRLGLDFRARFERHMQEPLVLMTQRSRLDAFLAEQASAAGADFRDGVRVDELALLDGGVHASLNGHKVAANWLVCADGVNGTAARSIGVDDGRTYGVALEANVPYGVVSEEEYRGRLFLELANVPGGYGWVFPKGDHVNVGVGGWEREGPRLRSTSRGSVASTGSRSRASRTSAATAFLFYTRARDSLRDARPCSATRPVSSIRSQATASTRRSFPPGSRRRRSSPATSPRTTASCDAPSRPS